MRQFDPQEVPLQTLQAVAAAPKNRYEFLDAADLDASAPPPIKWLIPCLILAGSVVGLVGRTSTLKSWFELFLARVVACGISLLPGVPGVAGTVLVLDYENGAARLHRRNWALRSLGTPARGALRFLTMPDFHLGPEFTGFFEEYVADNGSAPDLCFVDTFRAATPDLEENDSSARKFIDMLKALAERFGTAFVLLHHSGKGKAVGLDMPRGSSAFVDAVDSLLTLERDDPGKTVVTIRTPKDRDADDRREYTFEIGPHLPKFVALREGSETSSVAAVEAAVLGAVAKSPGLNSAALRQAVGGNAAALNRAVKALKEASFITSGKKTGYQLTQLGQAAPSLQEAADDD